MKKIVYTYIHYLQLLCIAAVIMFVSSCQDDKVEPPIITGVVNYAASPNDTVVTTIQTGQWVVLLGKNLSGVTQVYFGSIPATINTAYFTDQSLVVQLPNIPFELVPADDLNIITAISAGGIATFNINIVGDPIITHIRNYADAPNDTIMTSLAPGQQINMIGFNLSNATAILFQGVDVDLDNIMYTDSSVIVQVPEDFSTSDLSKKNIISYTTDIGTGTYTIPIIVPIVVDPLLELLTGGVGPGKTWVLDLNANGTSTYFDGPLYFSGEDLRWEYGCAEGGNCWTWFPPLQSWMPAPADYGTMTFSVDANGTIVKVVQKVISGSGTFEGSYALDSEAKILSFSGVVPLNMGWTSADWSYAYVLMLNEDALQIGFHHTSKAELEIYNYIAQ